MSISSTQSSRRLTTPILTQHQPRRLSSTTTTNMADKKSLIDSLKERRTLHRTTKDVPISDDRIVELTELAVKHVPSSFNSQSTRLVVLLKDEHDKFWDMTLEILKPLVPADKFGQTEQRIAGFRAGYGTVCFAQILGLFREHPQNWSLTNASQILFFEDPEPVYALQKNFPIYADKFPGWTEHTSAMHQYFLWMALEAEGLGASLQHYNPLVDQKVQQTWKVPQEWSLKAQLVFGGRDSAPAEKTFKPIHGERLFVHGK